MSASDTSVAPKVRASSSVRPLLAACGTAVSQIEWRALVPVLVLLLVIHVAAATVLLTAGLPIGYAPSGLTDMVVMFLAGVVICSGYILGPQIGSDMMRQYRGLTPTPFLERLSNLTGLIVSGWALALIFCAVLLVNSNLKPAIPVLNARTYDLQLETVERTVCGGVLPSTWLLRHPSGIAVHIWDFIYDLFGMFLFVSMMIALHDEGMRGGARLVFALSAGLCVCLILAVLVPTRGPIFVHPEWFGALQDTESGRLARYLNHTVEQYVAAPGVRYAVAGIAAMPSFHVLSWTCGVLCWRPLPGALRALGGILVLCNWASTVVLGWHYALDGLVGMVVAVCVFQLAARIIPRADATRA